MSISAHQPPAPAAALVRARDEVAELHNRLWAGVGDLDLVEVVEGIAGVRAQLTAIEAAVLAEVDTRQVPRKRLQWASTTDWYAHAAGTTRAQAKRTVRHAHDLVGERSATLAALRTGEVSPAQAAVVCAGVSDLPGDRMLRRRAEVVLLEEATRLDASDLARAARHVLGVVDPDGSERRAEADLEREDRAAHAQRFFSVRDPTAQGARRRGPVAAEAAAIKGGDDDHRTAGELVDVRWPDRSPGLSRATARRRRPWLP